MNKPKGRDSAVYKALDDSTDPGKKLVPPPICKKIYLLKTQEHILGIGNTI
jgi:hypothetical protein